MEPDLAGKITKVELTDPSSFEMGWSGHPSAVIHLEGGVCLLALVDPEMNGMGTFYLQSIPNRFFGPLRPGQIEGEKIAAIRKITPIMAHDLVCKRKGHEQYIILSNGDELIVAGDDELNRLGYLCIEEGGKFFGVSNTKRRRSRVGA